MATITTKFNVGEKLFTIDAKTMKIKEFEVGSIIARLTNDGTSVSYYEAGDHLNSHDEGRCFADRHELLTFIEK